MKKILIITGCALLFLLCSCSAVLTSEPSKKGANDPVVIDSDADESDDSGDSDDSGEVHDYNDLDEEDDADGGADDADDADDATSTVYISSAVIGSDGNIYIGEKVGYTGSSTIHKLMRYNTASKTMEDVESFTGGYVKNLCHTGGMVYFSVNDAIMCYDIASSAISLFYKADSGINAFTVLSTIIVINEGSYSEILSVVDRSQKRKLSTLLINESTDQLLCAEASGVTTVYLVSSDYNCLYKTTVNLTDYTIAAAVHSPLNTANETNSPIILTKDQSGVLTKNGKIFNTSDLIYSSSLTSEYNDILYDDNKFYTVTKDKIIVYSADNYALLKQVDLAGCGLKILKSGDVFYVIRGTTDSTPAFLDIVSYNTSDLM